MKFPDDVIERVAGFTSADAQAVADRVLDALTAEDLVRALVLVDNFDGLIATIRERDDMGNKMETVIAVIEDSRAALARFDAATQGTGT